eukprot:3326639-Rhodomonas_salina.1
MLASCYPLVVKTGGECVGCDAREGPCVCASSCDVGEGFVCRGQAQRQRAGPSTLGPASPSPVSRPAVCQCVAFLCLRAISVVLEHLDYVLRSRCSTCALHVGPWCAAHESIAESCRGRHAAGADGESLSPATPPPHALSGSNTGAHGPIMSP